MNAHPAAPLKRCFRSVVFSLRAQMLMSFALLVVLAATLIGAVTMFGIPFSGYSGFYGHERAAAVKNLSLVADLKKDRLMLWLEERRKDIRALAANENLERSAKQLQAVVANNLKSGADSAALRTVLLNQRTEKDLTRDLVVFKNAHGDYQKIQLADISSGLVLASTDERQVGEFLARDSLLAGTGAATNDVSAVLEKDRENGTPYLVFSERIVDRSQEIGDRRKLMVAVIAYTETDGFIRPMLYTGEGLGKTGDILLVDRSVTILMSLKYPLADGTRPRVLNYRVRAEPAERAARGEEGMIEARDYRGVPVLAASRYIPLTPGQGWGMVVKMDRAELFGPLWRHIGYSALMGSIGIVLAVGLAMLTANRILKPIESLSRTAQEVAAGHFSVRSPVARQDEVGALAETFNSMIERVENWHRDLEKQVEDRTTTLNQVNSELTKEIEERSRAEQALAEEKRRLAVTLRSIGDAVITTDINGTVASLNRMGEQLTGWTEEQAVGQPLDEVLHIVDDRTRRRCDNPALKVVNTKEQVDLDECTVLIAKDGTERFIADSAAPVRDEARNILGVVLVFRDITDRVASERVLRESEERFRQLAENIQEAFWLSEPNLPWARAYVSPAFERMWGRRTEEVCGNPDVWGRSLHEDDFKRVVSAYEDFIARGQDFNEEYRILRPDGSVRWIWDRAFAVKDKQNTVIRIAGIAQDITQRKIDQERQNQLVEEIRHFAYIVSHDLRAPLINLKGFCDELELALEVVRRFAPQALPHLTGQEQSLFVEALDSDVPEALRYITSSTFRMDHLVNAILVLSRLGHRRLDLQPLNMEGLVHETLDLMAHQITEQGVKVTVGRLPEVVADRTSMEQIMANLISNAVNYLDPDRPGELEIRGERYGDETAFHVTDNGVGMKPHEVSRAFEIFQRIGQVDVPGEGMGLAYVRTLVRRHEGCLSCTSRPGVGSTFTFTIAHRPLPSQEEPEM